jgi:hypothetical protein
MRRRRGSFQFGLLTLFIATAFAGFVCAMPGWAQQMAAGLALGMAAGFLLTTGFDFVWRR